MIDGRTLLARGWPSGPLIGQALRLASTLTDAGTPEPDALALLDRAWADPESVTSAEAGFGLAQAVVAHRYVPEPVVVRDEPLAMPVWGRELIDDRAVRQTGDRDAAARDRRRRADARRPRRLRRAHRRRGGLGRRRGALHGRRRHRLPHDALGVPGRRARLPRRPPRRAQDGHASRVAVRDRRPFQARSAPPARGPGRPGLAGDPAPEVAPRQGARPARHVRDGQPLRRRRPARRRGRGRRRTGGARGDVLRRPDALGEPGRRGRPSRPSTPSWPRPRRRCPRTSRRSPGSGSTPS